MRGDWQFSFRHVRLEMFKRNPNGNTKINDLEALKKDLDWKDTLEDFGT